MRTEALDLLPLMLKEVPLAVRTYIQLLVSDRKKRLQKRRELKTALKEIDNSAQTGPIEEVRKSISRQLKLLSLGPEKIPSELTLRLVRDRGMSDVWKTLRSKVCPDDTKLRDFLINAELFAMPRRYKSTNVVSEAECKRSVNRCDEAARLARKLKVALEEVAPNLDFRLSQEWNLSVPNWVASLTHLEKLLEQKIPDQVRRSYELRLPVRKGSATNARRTWYMLSLAKHVIKDFGSPLHKVVAATTTVVLGIQTTPDDVKQALAAERRTKSHRVK